MLVPLTSAYSGPLLVFAPAAATEQLLGAGNIRLLEVSGAFVRVIANEPGAVAGLYSAGALLVVPGRPAGCFPR